MNNQCYFYVVFMVEDGVPVKISIRNWVRVDRAVWNMVKTRATCVTWGLPILRMGKWGMPAPACWFLPPLFWLKTFLKATTRFLWSSAGHSCRGLELDSSRSATGRHSVSRCTSEPLHSSANCCLTKAVVSCMSNELDLSLVENQPRIGCHCVKFDCFDAT